MRSFWTPAYIRDQQPSLELFDDLLLHGERFILDNVNTEEKFLFHL